MIKTKRLNIYIASDEQMAKLVEEESIPGLKAAYQEMSDGCRLHPDERIWHAAWFMELNDGTGAIVGNLSFKGISEEGTVEVGYGTNPEFEGQGYMTEAVAAVAEWAEAQPGVRTVEAEAEDGNIASVRVLEKCGFIRTGIIGEEGPRFARKNFREI